MENKNITKAKGLRHQIVSAWKIFKSISSDELEDKVNDFAVNHEVLDVKFQFKEISQAGMMLCDRPNPMGNSFTLNIASVKYKRDLTSELVTEALTKWLTEKIDERFKGAGLSSIWRSDILTCTSVTVKEAQMDYLRELTESDEYKALSKNLEAKYSLPDENESK